MPEKKHFEKMRIDRATVQSDNKGRLKLSAREPIFLNFVCSLRDGSLNDISQIYLMPKYGTFYRAMHTVQSAYAVVSCLSIRPSGFRDKTGTDKTGNVKTGMSVCNSLACTMAWRFNFSEIFLHRLIAWPSRVSCTKNREDRLGVSPPPPALNTRAVGNLDLLP